MPWFSKGESMNHVYRLDDDKTLRVIHGETGVVIASVPKIDDKVKEPLYCKAYLASMMDFGVKAGGKIGLLFCLISMINRHGEVVLRNAQRDELAEKMGMSSGTVSNYISFLLKEGFLYKMPGETNSVYWVNPVYFAAGTWNDVKERMALYEVARRMYSRGRQDSADSTGGIGGNSPDDVLPVEPCEGQA